MRLLTGGKWIVGQRIACDTPDYFYHLERFGPVDESERERAVDEHHRRLFGTGYARWYFANYGRQAA